MRSTTLRATLAAMTLILLIAACSNTDSPDGSSGATPAPPGTGPKTVTIALAQQNGSGESGMAVLTAAGLKTKVVVTLTGAPTGVAQPSHIHPGTCATLDPKPKYPLSNTVNGRASSQVDVALDDLLAGTFAVNIHKSGPEAAVYVACGNIKA